MKLTFEQIKAVTTGAEKITCENGLYQFLRFNEQETAVIDNPNVTASAGIQMRFKTDAKKLFMKVHMKELTPIRSYFAFDVFVNGALAGSIQNLEDEACVGDYANQKYTLGTFESTWELAEGEKEVRVLFPHSGKPLIEVLELVDATYITPVSKEKTIVFYGDSITQGYDSLHPSCSYASRLAEALDATVINKALGGAVFDPRLVEASSVAKADYLVVAFGTNDWNMVDLATFRKSAEGFSKALQRRYPGVPKYVITPLWRPDWEATKQCGPFHVLEDTIKEFFEGQPDVAVISGFDLIPHEKTVFGDLVLHPSGAGFAHYYQNILPYIK